MSSVQQTPATRTRHLGGWRTGDAAIVAGRNVASICEHPGWGDLLSSIDAYCERQNVSTANSGVLSQAEYADHFGEMRGLKLVDSLARAVIDHGRKELERSEGV